MRWISEKSPIVCESCGSRENIVCHSKKWSDVKRIERVGTFVIPSTLFILLCEQCLEEEIHED